MRERFDVVATIVEPAEAQRKALRRRGKWGDAVAAEYHRARRTILGLNRYRRAVFATLLAASPGEPQPTLVVDTINDPCVAATVAFASPDVCVITCTTVLSDATIAGIGTDVINIHGGHLPDYRGCHCFFFALSEGQFDKIGSTIHFVDSGVDTGDIIEVVRPAITASDNAERLYCRAERLAAERLRDLLADLEAGRPLARRPQVFRGRLCLRRDRRPMHDVSFFLRRSTGRLRLPTVADHERWQPGESTPTPAPERRADA